MTNFSSRRARRLTDKQEAEIQKQIAENPDDGDLTEAQARKGRPFAQAFPELMESVKRARGRPPVEAPKQAVTLRVSPATLDKFKAKGADWRLRMAKALDRAKVS
jgi:uncharacterized protein (DUF4415 family)